MLVSIISRPSSLTSQIPYSWIMALKLSKNGISVICSPSRISCSRKYCHYHWIYHKYDERILCQFGTLVRYKKQHPSWDVDWLNFFVSVYIKCIPHCTNRCRFICRSSIIIDLLSRKVPRRADPRPWWPWPSLCLEPHTRRCWRSCAGQSCAEKSGRLRKQVSVSFYTSVQNVYGR